MRFKIPNDQENIIKPITYAGHWEMGGPHGIRMSQRHKPGPVTRFLCRWLLEWVWVDNP